MSDVQGPAVLNHLVIEVEKMTFGVALLQTSRSRLVPETRDDRRSQISQKKGDRVQISTAGFGSNTIEDFNFSER